MRDIDAHALLLDGEPLLAHAPVEYVLDEPRDPSSLSSGPALVVADPTGTLRAARDEGRALAQARKGAILLVGEDASRARVLDALGRASSFFFSGHATYAGADGWDSVRSFLRERRAPRDRGRRLARARPRLRPAGGV